MGSAPPLLSVLRCGKRRGERFDAVPAQDHRWVVSSRAPAGEESRSADGRRRPGTVLDAGTLLQMAWLFVHFRGIEAGDVDEGAPGRADRFRRA